VTVVRIPDNARPDIGVVAEVRTRFSTRRRVAFAVDDLLD
jgi:hypothetical protein